jgi:hypothetical protein
MGIMVDDVIYWDREKVGYPQPYLVTSVNGNTLTINRQFEDYGTVFWLARVLQGEGLEGWIVRVSEAGNMCWHQHKRIDVGPEHRHKRGMYLHEIAHAVLGDCGPKLAHDAIFADKLTELIDKYLVDK